MADGDSSHLCFFPGCTQRVPAFLWGCQGHWGALPGPLRGRVHAAFAGGAGVRSEAFARSQAEVTAWARAQGQSSGDLFGMPQGP